MRQRLKDESGIALVMAVGIMAVLMIAGGTVIFYASSNARNAEYSVENARAVNLAEAGMNYARAHLWNDTDPTTPTTFSGGPVTLEGGTVTYSGTYDSGTKIWTLTGTGTYTNPTGGTAAVSRTASSEVLVMTSIPFDPAWGYLFADTTSACTGMKNFITIDAPLYVRGNLCMENSARITSELVRVRGTVDIKDTASIGTVGDSVAQVDVAGGCRYPWSGAYVTNCGSGQMVYHDSFSTSPPDIPKPPVDLGHWYANAKPGPMSSTCTTGSFPGTFDTNTTLDRSNGTTYLFPTSSYDCTVKDGSGNQLGRIAYTPGNPGTFVIDGVVFFDGKLEMQSTRNVRYQGRGTIYASDEIKIQNDVKICGASDCTEANWDPNTNLLAFVGGATVDNGFLIENNTQFQGAIYVVNDYVQKNDGAYVCGPVIAQELKIENGSQNCYVPFTSLAPGMPSSSTTPVVTLTNVPNSFTTD